MNDESEELLNFRTLIHKPGDEVVHIWSRKIYSVEKYLGKSSLGYPHYYVNDDKGSVSTMDSTEVAPADHRIIKVLDHWKEKLRQSGKTLIVVGRHRDSTRLVCWFHFGSL